MARKKLSKSARIRNYAMANPGVTATQVAGALDVTPAYAAQTLRRLRSSGVLPPKGAVKSPVSRLADPKAKWKTVVITTSDASTQPAEDLVNHPPHYKVGGVETIDFIEAKLSPEEFRGYLKGSILKYGSRVGHKGEPTLDAGKLAWYAERLASLLKKAA